MFNFRSQGPMDFESLKNNVILDLEKTEEKLMHRYPVDFKKTLLYVS